MRFPNKPFVPKQAAIASLILLSWGVTVGAAAYAKEAQHLAITHGPYLESPREHSVTIVWFTNKKCTSWVEYGDGKDMSSKAVGHHHGLIDANETRHVIQLDNIESGKIYRYRVVSREIVLLSGYRRAEFGPTVSSQIFSFQAATSIKSRFSFCSVSDIHEQASMLRETLQRVDWHGVDLVFLNGDMVDSMDQKERIWNGFLDACMERFARQIPLVYVRGNHETRGVFARGLMDFAPTPEGRFYYSFNHGGVHFIVLDSGEDKKDSDVEYSGLAAFDSYRREQAAWLERDIRTDACRNALYRVAVFHIPTHGDDNYCSLELRRMWTPLLNAGGVQLAICGHTHESAHIPAASGANQYPIVITAPENVLRVDVNETHMHIALSATGKRLPAPFDVSPKRATK